VVRVRQGAQDVLQGRDAGRRERLALPLRVQRQTVGPVRVRALRRPVQLERAINALAYVANECGGT